MATYYFDRNGTTAGFGTLTGAWDTSTASWTTSTAGTAAPAAVTFTNADVAGFGFTGTTATAGTATISTGVTVTLNQITTANLAGPQGIAATGTGTLNLAGASPTINVGSAGGLTISAPITGSAGFTKSGAGFLEISNTTAGSNISGTLSMTSSGFTQRLQLTGSGTGTLMPLSSISTFALGSGGNLVYVSNTLPYTEDASFTNTGGGCIVYTYTNTTVTFSPAVAGGVSGYSAYWSLNPDNTVRNCSAAFTELPGNSATIQYDMYATTGTNAPVFTINVNGGGSTAAAFNVRTSTTGATYTPSLVDNSNAAVTYSGAVTKDGTAATATWALSGTNTSGATLSGIISASAGTLAISKSGTGRWNLSNANTYTGTTSISAGTLSAQSNTAFGAAASAVTMTGGTIEVTGGVALNKAGAALTLVSNAGANALSSPAGTNSIACAGVTLSSTAIVDVASGASLTLNNTATMSGITFGITKNNSGEFNLGTFDNNYTGAVTINAGTLTVGTLANTNSNSSLGTGAGTSAIALTGTLKYAGTAPAGHSTNRSLTFTGSAPTLDASGTGPATFSACTTASVTAGGTITFTGSSTAANTLSANLSNGAGTLNVAKSGAGKWVLSGATVNYTGTTTVSAGTLDMSGANRTLSGGVSISDGTLASTGTIAANTVMTGGKITAQLTGNKTLDVNSGTATLQPINNINDFTGNTTVASGATLQLVTAATNISTTGGKVLGNSNVSVTGNIKTYGDTVQKGQMRYGGNLTFQAGAKLYVGSATP